MIKPKVSYIGVSGFFLLFYFDNFVFLITLNACRRNVFSRYGGEYGCVKFNFLVFEISNLNDIAKIYITLAVGVYSMVSSLNVYIY